mmetsp:Transcript_19205/g.32484  ORF Transcript_19205/g.32484 Transcript_19205/m.32484 type:complete len:668 (-) Transcript_19205:1203-3206(-)
MKFSNHTLLGCFFLVIVFSIVISFQGYETVSQEEMRDMLLIFSNASGFISSTPLSSLDGNLKYYFPQPITGLVESATRGVVSTQRIDELQIMLSTYFPLINEMDWYVLAQVLFYFTCFWAVLEIVFVYVVYAHLLPPLQELQKPHAYPTDTVDFMVRILEVVDDLDCYEFEEYVSGFFCGAPFDEVYHENFRSFLAWSMYSKHLHDVTPTESDNINIVIMKAGQKYPELLRLKPGFNDKVKHVAMTLEPIRIIHRPLFAYVVVHIIEIITNALFLRACGFQCLEMNGLTYWYRQSGKTWLSSRKGRREQQEEEELATSDPMLFLHGITTGWTLYMGLIRALGKNRPMLLVELDAIKIKSMNFRMPTPREFSERVLRILDRHAIRKVSIVGHSFGSITAGWLISRYPSRVSHLTLVDPVAMLLAFPDVAFRFLYRDPTSIMEWMICFCASRELTVAHTLHRHFWWYNNVLWLEDVPEHIGVVVGIAAKDEIIHARAVHEYVHKCRLKRLQQAEERALMDVPVDGSDGNGIGNGNGSCSVNYSPVPHHRRNSNNHVRRRGSFEKLLNTADSFSSFRTFGSFSSLFGGNISAAEDNHNSNSIDDEGQDINDSWEVVQNISPASDIAKIECHYWENYSHGQILICNSVQAAFVEAISKNEKRTTMGMHHKL